MIKSAEKKEIIFEKIRYPYFEYHSDKSPTILMIHGLRGTHDGLEFIANHLPNYRVILAELPGFGQAAAFENMSHDLVSYTAYVTELIKQSTTTPPVLLGHSFGSIVASSVAASQPNVLSKLILVNPIGAPALEGPKAVLTKIALGYYKLGSSLPEKAGKLWLSTQISTDVMSKVLTKTKNKELRRMIRDQHRMHFSTFASNKVVAESFAASVGYTVRDFAAQISYDTLLVVGEVDDITPLNKQRELQKLFPHASLQIIKGSGHLVHYETPQEVASYVSEFLQ